MRVGRECLLEQAEEEQAAVARSTADVSLGDGPAGALAGEPQGGAERGHSGIERQLASDVA
jgi:hypothetical protein